jgi:CDP-glucose 4,6-dehydratase
MESLVTDSTFKYYENKKIFVTGHTGFKGAWLITWLHAIGAQIKGYALAPENNQSIFNKITSKVNIESIIADIRDRQRLCEEIQIFKPDFIFHLAAQPLVRRSYERPSETFEVNAIGTANVLEAVKQLPNKCTVVIITTDKVYQNKEIDYCYKEEDILGGHDPYSASKAATEIVVTSFRNSFFNAQDYVVHKKKIATARAGNVIGGGDWGENRIFPDIIKSLQANLPIQIRNPDAIRPWQHVLEPLSGYLLLGILLDTNLKNYSEAYNFGPLLEDHLTVKDLVELAIKYWGNGNWTAKSEVGQLHEAHLLKLNITRAISELDWHPRLTGKEAIEWTIDWYKHPEESIFDYTLSQINKYQKNDI